MLNLYYDELIGKIEEYEEKKYSMVDNYTLDKVLDKKESGIRILIDTDDKDGHKFYPKLFL